MGCLFPRHRHPQPHPTEQVPILCSDLPTVYTLAHESCRAGVTRKRRARAAKAIAAAGPLLTKRIEQEREKVRNVVAHFNPKRGVVTPFTCAAHSQPDAATFIAHLANVVVVAIALDAELPPEIHLTMNISDNLHCATFSLTPVVFHHTKNPTVSVPVWPQEEEKEQEEQDPMPEWAKIVALMTEIEDKSPPASTTIGF